MMLIAAAEELGDGIAQRQFALVIGESFHDMDNAGLAGFITQVLQTESDQQSAACGEQETQQRRQCLVVFNAAARQQQGLHGFHQHAKRNDDAGGQQADRYCQHGKLWQCVQAGEAQPEIIQPFVPPAL